VEATNSNIMNKQIKLTQQRIDELNQQFSITANENWLVLKQDLENQLFVLKCKELLKIFYKSDAKYLCWAFAQHNNPDRKFWTKFINELWEFANDFLIESNIKYYHVGLCLIFAYDNGYKLETNARIIRINFLKYLIKKYEQNIKTNN